MSSGTVMAQATVWQSRVSHTTGEPAVPVFNRKLRGDVPFWVPRRYVSVVAKTMDGRRFRQRDLAAATGYTVGGVHKALSSLKEMAIGDLETVRGHYGWSRFLFNRDCQSNVSSYVRSSSKEGLRSTSMLEETLELPPQRQAGPTFRERLLAAGLNPEAVAPIFDYGGDQ